MAIPQIICNTQKCLFMASAFNFLSRRLGAFMGALIAPSVRQRSKMLGILL
jgi:hypothetical protein